MAKYEIGDLVWRITGDSSGLSKSLGKAEDKVGKTKSVFSKAAKVIGTALIAVGIGKFVKSLIGAASDAEETANKFGVVFSSVATDANKAAKNLANSYGLSRTASKQLLSDTGDLLTGFGLTQKEALKLSTTASKLGADLASFTNYAGGAEGATQALTKAMLGEREQVKMLGIAITETELVKFAADQGLAWKEMDRGAKASLTLQLAMKQSKNAIGDFERSIDSYANQMRIAEANVNDLQEGLGSALLPVVTLGVKAFNSFADTLEEPIQKLNDFVKSAEGAKVIGDIIGNIAGSFMAFKTLVVPIVNAVGEGLNEILKPFADLTGEGVKLQTVMMGLAKFITITSAAIRVLGTFIGGTIQALINLGKVAFSTGKLVANVFAAASGQVNIGEIKKNFDSLVEANKKFGRDIVDTFVNVKDIVGDTISSFDEEAASLGEKSRNEFLKTQKSISDSIQSVLTAQQQQVKGVEDTGDALEGATEKAGSFYDELKRTNEAFDELTRIERVNAISEALSNLTSGIQDLFNSIDAFNNAVLQSGLDRLDAQMEAELEAAGVAEETAVQQAEAELSAAQEANDAEAVAEAQKALRKARIEEKYQKKKAQLEYKASLRAWEFQRALAAIQLVMAPLQAYVSGLSAPWPLTIPMAIIQAALAGAAAAIQYAAVVEAKPKPPKFATGGIVPGSSSSGDNVLARVNSGEMILNDRQQANLFDIANQGGGAGNITVYLGAKLIYQEMYRASKNGDLNIFAGAVTDK